MMANGGTAQIIPFPRPSGPETRLAAALAGLQAALDQQREAVGTWRRNLRELQDGVEGLGASLAGYRGRLGELRAGVGRLGAEAEALARHDFRPPHSGLAETGRLLPTPTGTADSGSSAGPR